MRRQKPLPGGRPSIWGAIDPQLRTWAEREAKRDDCSVSLVVNSALSYASGIALLGDPHGNRKRHRLLKTLYFRRRA